MPSASGEGPETVFQNVRARIPLKLLPSTLTGNEPYNAVRYLVLT